MTAEGAFPLTASGPERKVTTEEQTRYRERTPWASWVDLIYCGAIVSCAYSVFVTSGGGILFRLAVVAAILAAGWGLRMVLGGLTVLVQDTRIVMHLGSVRLVRKMVPFDSIVSLESVRYRPLVEFGGWGVRGAGKKKAWTARGDRAVVIGLEEGRRLYVGSDHPQRLEDAIRGAVAGRRKRDAQGR